MADTEQPSGTLETREDAGTGGAGQVKLWLDALALAEREERDWVKKAESADERYRDEKDRRLPRFNILHANIETLAPALYNSTPVPDVRRRHGDADPLGKAASQVIERSLVAAIDSYDFDEAMQGIVFDSLMVGRGVPRVRYMPTFDANGLVVYEEAICEVADWRDFRRGPGRRWREVPWVAFRERITREEAVEKFGPVGAKVKLDWVLEGAETQSQASGGQPPDIFKRLTVWQIWDKDKRQVVHIAPEWKNAPLKVVDDPLGLRGFFPCPRPLYDIEDKNNLTPIVPYSRYADQADELDTVTRRIAALTKVLKWRGVRDASIPEFDTLKDADDGDLVPSEGVVAWLDKGGLDKAVWLMPIERLIQVIRELIVQRETIKQTIFELTGLSDIMRGQSEPDETLGAQRIKTQWGSLRLQRRQREVQRIARDVLRLKAEIIAEKFDLSSLQSMSDMQLPMAQDKQQAQLAAQAAQAGQQPVPPEVEAALSQPSWEEVQGLLKNDVLRGFKIDVETDSTIQADLGYAQKNMSDFVQGIGGFFAAIGPAVQSGDVPKDVAADLLTAFSRKFKLGKQAEDALDRLGKTAQQPSPPQADPAAAQAQAEQAKLQAQAQAEAQKLELEREKMAGQAQIEQARMALDREKAAADLTLRREEMAARDALERDKASLQAGMSREETIAAHGPDIVQAFANVQERLVGNSEQSSAVLAEVAQSLASVAEAVGAAVQNMNAPKRIVRDNKGRPVGIEPVSIQ